MTDLKNKSAEPPPVFATTIPEIRGEKMKQLSTRTRQKEAKDSALTKSGKAERQDAFIQAYLASAFNISSACRQVGIDRSTYYKWIEDTEFISKFNEAKESKKDFIESMLLERVAKGDTIATIFACKCLLADRGYVEKNHTHITAESKPVFSKEQHDAAIDAMIKMG
jgi:transposase-like protein